MISQQQASFRPINEITPSYIQYQALTFQQASQSVKLEYQEFRPTAPIEVCSSIGTYALKNTTKSKKPSSKPRKLLNTPVSEDMDTLSLVKIEENSTISPLLQSCNSICSATSIVLPKSEKCQNKEKSQQSKVKNANKYYFKKILAYFKENLPSHHAFPQEKIQELLQNIKISGKRENYTLKHFRAISLKLTDKNLQKMRNEDKETHDIIYTSVFGKDLAMINAFKMYFTQQILTFLEENSNIKHEISMNHKDPALVERYQNWSTHISINLRKMMSGEYVSRF